jgi:hypothetical protein
MDTKIPLDLFFMSIDREDRKNKCDLLLFRWLSFPFFSICSCCPSHDLLGCYILCSESQIEVYRLMVEGRGGSTTMLRSRKSIGKIRSQRYQRHVNQKEVEMWV